MEERRDTVVRQGMAEQLEHLHREKLVLAVLAVLAEPQKVQKKCQPQEVRVLAEHQPTLFRRWCQKSVHLKSVHLLMEQQI